MRVGGFVSGLVHSLRFKVTAGVILILAAAMGFVFALQYRWFQREMIERLGLYSTPLSDVIKGSLTHGMESRNLAEIEAILENVSRQPGVIKVFVVDKRGEVRFSPCGVRWGTGSRSATRPARSATGSSRRAAARPSFPWPAASGLPERQPHRQRARVLRLPRRAKQDQRRAHQRLLDGRDRPAARHEVPGDGPGPLLTVGRPP
jgi:hypothetical protein